MKDRYIVVYYDRLGQPYPLRVFKHKNAAEKYAARSIKHEVLTIGYETRKNV